MVGWKLKLGYGEKCILMISSLFWWKIFVLWYWCGRYILFMFVYFKCVG